jgi:MFS family permease
MDTPTRIAEVDATSRSADTSTLLEKLGGRRGLVDGALPPVVFVVVNAVTGLLLGPLAPVPPLWWALGAATGTACALIVARVVRGEPVAAAIRGLIGLALAAALAAWTGQARDFFLPGIYVDGLYAAAFAGSALVGRPLVGYLYVALFRRHHDWRTNPRLRRLFTLATFGWTAVYALRVTATSYLYRLDVPALLAIAKIALGWPLTVLAVVATLGALRRVDRDSDARPVSVAPEFR